MSMAPSFSTGVAVAPDAVYPAGQSPTDEDFEEVALWEALNPCPQCGATPHESPEGTHGRTGDPFWEYGHCWKCGYRPASNTPSDDRQMRLQWEAFQKFQKAEAAKDIGKPGMAPPAPDQVEALKAEIAAMKADLAERNSPTPGIGTSVPVAPSA
jgi:hypothetical protein